MQHTVSLTDILHSATNCVRDKHITQCNTLCPWQICYTVQHPVSLTDVTRCNTLHPWQTYYSVHTLCPWQTYHTVQNTVLGRHYTVQTHCVLDRHITLCNTLCPWQTYSAVQRYWILDRHVTLCKHTVPFTDMLHNAHTHTMSITDCHERTHASPFGYVTETLTFLQKPSCCVYNDKVIYSINNTTYIINIINLATCFGSLNHPQANSYNKVKVHSASAHTMGSHTVHCRQVYNIDNICSVIDWINYFIRNANAWCFLETGCERTGFIWLKRPSNGRLFWTRFWISGFRKSLRITLWAQTQRLGN